MKKWFKIVMLIIAGITIMYYFPQTINKIIKMDQQKIVHIRMELTVPQGEAIEDEWGNIVPDSYFDIYNIEIDSIDNEEYTDIMSILDDTRYIPKLQNVLPIEQTISNQDFIYTGNVYFSLGDDYKAVHFMGDNRVTVNSKNEKTKVYHMSNKNVLDKFAQYLKEYGTHRRAPEK